MNIDINKVENFATTVVSDIAAAFSGVMTNIGHSLGLYRAMAGAGEITSTQLSQKTNTHERYVREWLNNQVAGQYIVYNKKSSMYRLPDEHIPVLADPESPVFLVPALEVASSLWLDEEKITKVFRTGEGIAWNDHHHRLFCGSEALFKPGYKAHLCSEWIAAMKTMEGKLKAGGKVADIGCGHGASTRVMAKTFPNSTFIGYDSHHMSIKTAKQRCLKEGGLPNIEFETQHAKDYTEKNFDLICFMDCLHDMGDPIGAAKYALQALKPDGSLLLVEPAAGNNLSENINPISRLYYAASAAVCTPCSKSQEVGLALGAQAGEEVLSSVLKKAGFTTITRIAETPFNIILEAHR